MMLYSDRFIPCLTSASLSVVLMPVIRSAIPFISTSLKRERGEVGYTIALLHYHLFLYCGLVSISVAILAPLIGGLEYIGRTIIFSCDSRAVFSSGESHNIVTAPTLSPKI